VVGNSVDVEVDDDVLKGFEGMDDAFVADSGGILDVPPCEVVNADGGGLAVEGGGGLVVVVAVESGLVGGLALGLVGFVALRV
jgi:hypothetical protein